jgi:co-chaperonin GroES (HSP10)
MNELPDNFPLVPFEDVCVILQDETDKSEGGIILTGDYRKFPSGRVVAVGPGRTYSFYMDASGNTLAGKFVPNLVEVGDYVVFGKYQSGGEPIDFEGKTYILARVGDLAGKSRDKSELKIRLAAK